MGGDEGFLGQLGPVLVRVLPMLDERSRRLVLGMVAEAEGEGGTGRVAVLTGASWQTVANGKAEVAAEEVLPAGRVRRAGGGRRKLTVADPGLLPALEGLIQDAMRGDPVSPLVWTTRSVRHLAEELGGLGHRCSPQTVWRVLREAGYTLQSNARAQEGRQHPDRDAQFRYIAARAAEFRAAGQPVISVDAKKKEQVGNYGQDGRDWRPAGDPAVVRSHDFPDRDGRHAIPYGIYDQENNTGFVNVGTDGHTAALAVESIRRWHAMAGKAAYPDATRLLLTCDSGGSNAASSRMWKAGLAQLAQETGLDITVCHFPPGTSKWNPIEHRLFCQITLAWRSRPLTSYDVIIDTIGQVSTRTGLTCTAVLDTGAYPTGLEISDEQVKDIADRCLTRHDFHGDWNYTLHAAPRPAPPPGPGPAQAGPDPAATLNHPALTGIDPAALDTLAAALRIPSGAAREAAAYTRRQGRDGRKTASYATRRRLTLTGHLIALRLHDHLNLPSRITGPLLGIHPGTARHAITRTRRLLAASGIPVPPAAPPPQTRPRTLDDLRAYAATHGITITTPGTPRHRRAATPTTPP